MSMNKKATEFTVTEIGDVMVLDVSTGEDRYIPKSQFYDVGSVDEADVTRYTRDDALAAMLEFEHYGPWNNQPGDVL